MFQILVDFFQFLYKGVVTYASSDEGEAELRSILDRLEEDGIDIPFYEPSEPPLNVNGVEGSPTNFTDRFKEKHPEFYGGDEQ